MRSYRFCYTLVGLLALPALAYGQNAQPGLYENTSQMIWQQSPFPPGMKLPPGAQSPFGEGKHTNKVCVTQEQIDRYGPVVPERWGNDCHLVDISKNSKGMHANVVCSGELEGRGTFEAAWAAEGGGTGKVHFVGQMVSREFSAPIEFTSELVSVYKGRSCGSVKPSPMQD